MLHIVKLIERRWPGSSRTTVPALLALATIGLLVGVAVAMR